MRKADKGLRWITERFWPIKIALSITRLILLSLGLFGFTVILWIPGLILFFLKVRGLWKFPDRFYTTLAKTLHLITRIVYTKIEVSGKNNIPEAGKAIIAARHREIWDIPLMAFAALGRRKVKFIGREDLPWISFLEPAQDFVIQINRENITPSQYKKIIGALRQEQLIGIFPEGTRNPQPQDNENSYYAGLIRIAEREDAPIIPLNIAAEGGQKHWLSRLWNLGTKMNLKVGEPIEVSELKSRLVQDCSYQEVTSEDYQELTKYFLEEIVDKI